MINWTLREFWPWNSRSKVCETVQEIGLKFCNLPFPVSNKVICKFSEIEVK